MIRLLIDENLPPTLSTKLNCICLHVTDLGEQPTDRLIWDHGRRDGWIILTKDADFFEQLALEGPPPKVIWLRTGNMRRVDLETMLARLWPRIVSLIHSTDLVEIHPDRIEGIKFGS